MSSFLNKVKDVAEKASDKYQEKKNSSSKDEGTYDPSKNDDYSSSNKQSSNEVCCLTPMVLEVCPLLLDSSLIGAIGSPLQAVHRSRQLREETLPGIHQH